MIPDVVFAVGFTAAISLVCAMLGFVLNKLILFLYRRSPKVRRFFDNINFE